MSLLSRGCGKQGDRERDCVVLKVPLNYCSTEFDLYYVKKYCSTEFYLYYVKKYCSTEETLARAIRNM